MRRVETVRDLRIDFLRGICLLTIYTRHVRPNLFREFTPSAVGFSDAAEAFIFLSGLVSGHVYGKALQNGFLFCQLKSLRRCGQIYLAHTFTMFFSLGLFPLFFGVSDLNVGRFFQDPAWGLRHAFLLSFLPYTYGILPLYIFLLGPMPLVLWLSQRAGRWTVMLVSLLIYATVQIFPEIMRLPRPWTSIGYNPFAWQLLFVAGLILGNKPTEWGFRLPKSGIMLSYVLLTLVLCFFFKLFYVGQESPWRLSSDSLPWGKANLEPLRLFHFVLMAYFCWAVVPPAGPLYQYGWSTVVIHCGQHSLEVFCFGVILSNFANEFLRTFGASIGWQLAANAFGWSALLLFGTLLHAVNKVLLTPLRLSVGHSIATRMDGTTRAGPGSVSKAPSSK